jgi:hypothetical protein
MLVILQASCPFFAFNAPVKIPVHRFIPFKVLSHGSFYGTQIIQWKEKLTQLIAGGSITSLLVLDFFSEVAGECQLEIIKPRKKLLMLPAT